MGNTLIMAVSRSRGACQCLHALRPSTSARAAACAVTLPRHHVISSAGPREGQLRARDARFNARTLGASRRYAASSTHSSTNSSQKDLNATHARVQELAASVLKPADQPIPPEQRVLYVFEQLDAISRGLVDAKSINASVATPAPNATATSALLGSVNNRQSPPSVTKSSLLSLTSQAMEEIVRHPHVFITPAVLKAYIEVQSLLHQPSSFPDVLEMYASKPVPSVSGNTISFATPNTGKVNAAVPKSTADIALTAAISSHDLPLAIDIITTTYCTPTFRKAKMLRQMLVPASGLAIAPVAAYTLSQQFAEWQHMLDPQQATYMAFAGMMTYVSAVSMVGYVAVTTANDQMMRVTWAQGVPLWERWVREEERAAIDRVAAAWGFKDLGKRGDEEGVEWEELREWAGRRGMVLDSVALMEGME
ncbi:hypothetical protein B0A48_08135 [Cryoendolithus antarcticus]|uniref:Uncharacterized protein n=1 Tax=Cryoendolithus antarcticus TaxID=1507870 RepID=A0A1V8T115_9PEZI|nr:hypothetical protein B0A48_08135 [Cryoendolithus antarcticus]